MHGASNIARSAREHNRYGAVGREPALTIRPAGSIRGAAPSTRERGGIGRRTRFRFWRGNSCKGSSPFVRTGLVMFEGSRSSPRAPHPGPCRELRSRTRQPVRGEPELPSSSPASGPCRELRSPSETCLGVRRLVALSGGCSCRGVESFSANWFAIGVNALIHFESYAHKGEEAGPGLALAVVGACTSGGLSCPYLLRRGVRSSCACSRPSWELAEAMIRPRSPAMTR